MNSTVEFQSEFNGPRSDKGLIHAPVMVSVRQKTSFALRICRIKPVIFNVWPILGLILASYVSKILKISFIVTSSLLKASDFYSKVFKSDKRS